MSRADGSATFLFDTVSGQCSTFSMYFTYGESDRTTMSVRCESGTYFAAASISGAVNTAQPMKMHVSTSSRLPDHAF